MQEYVLTYLFELRLKISSRIFSINFLFYLFLWQCLSSNISSDFTLFFFVILYFIYFYFWLCWVFVSVRGLSPVAASGGHPSSRCAGLSLSQPLLLRSTGSRCAGSSIVAHGPSCSTACGIFPDQGSNPCPLPWQADSQPLRHQGSPAVILISRYTASMSPRPLSSFLGRTQAGVCRFESV